MEAEVLCLIKALTFNKPRGLAGPEDAQPLVQNLPGPLACILPPSLAASLDAHTPLGLSR